MVQALPPSPPSAASLGPVPSGDSRASAPTGGPGETFQAAMSAVLRDSDGASGPSGDVATPSPSQDDARASETEIKPRTNELAGLQAALLLQIAPLRPVPPTSGAGASASDGPVEALTAVGPADQGVTSSAPPGESLLTTI